MRSLTVAVTFTLLNGLVISELRDRILTPENIKVKETFRERRHFKPFHSKVDNFGLLRRSMPYFGPRHKDSHLRFHPHFVSTFEPYSIRYSPHQHRESYVGSHKYLYKRPHLLHKRAPWERPDWDISESEGSGCGGDSSYDSSRSSSDSSSSSAEDENLNPYWPQWHGTSVKNPSTTKQPKLTRPITPLTTSTELGWITPIEITSENTTPTPISTTQIWSTKITRRLLSTTLTSNTTEFPSTWNTEPINRVEWTVSTTSEATPESSTSNASSKHYTSTASYWDLITSSEPTNTTQISSTNLSPSLPQCIKSCFEKMTSDHRPVCGTNNVTYQNVKLLFCVQDCGVDVNLKSWSTCPTSVDGNMPMPTTTTTTDISEMTTLSQFTLACISGCQVAPEYNPVCGTNNITYSNLGELECAQLCGEDVELLCKFSCSARNCSALETDSTATLSPATSSSDMVESTSRSDSIHQCLKTCPVTSEFNPVCGTDNITYDNPGKLICAQICGVDVKPKWLTVCSSNSNVDMVLSTTSQPVTGNTTPSRFTLACIRGCQVTSEYNPVCGTNKITYGNIGRLECAKICGVNVELQSKSACKITDNNDKDESITSSMKPPMKENYDVTTDQIITTGYTVDQIILDLVFGYIMNPITSKSVTDTTDTTEDFSLFSKNPRFNSA